MINMMNFIPLNVFSNYALLKSALTLDDYLKALLKLEIKAGGISDPDMLFAYPHFYKKAKAYNIKPLFGVRVKVEDTELVFFIKSTKGYKDLLLFFELKNKGDFQLENLKDLTSELITILPSNNLTNIGVSSTQYRDYFKKWAMLTNDFYIGLESENEELRRELRTFATKYNYDIVAFPNIKYINKEDERTMQMIEAIREATTLDINANYIGNNNLPTLQELSEFYIENEINNTVKISDKIAFDLSEKHPLNFPLPGDYNPHQKIKELTNLALEKLGKNDDERYVKRLAHELEVITNLNFINYFLIVSDYVNFAKQNGILVGYGRGSAPGSLVSYLLGITHVDPLEHNLLFERFLNPFRVTMPDIDIDFMDIRRNEVIDYIKATYGEERVAQIVTFQTNAAKASLRDTGRIFNIDLKFINRLSNSLGTIPYSLRDAYKKVPLFKTLIDADRYNLEIIKNAVKLEGFPRQSGMHAAGIIIDGAPLYLNLPTFINNDMRVTQYEMGFLEEQGFLKVDILGLSNLTFIDNIIKEVNKNHKKNIDFYSLSFNDPQIYKVIRDGLTIGLFQLESEGMRKAIKEVMPTNFEDVSALLALYRPGPMQYISDYAKGKRGEIAIVYLNKEFEEILKPTHGIMIYQEQIIQIVQAMAGFSLAEADLMRRAISKKDEAIILKQKEAFLLGAKQKGFNKQDSEKVFNDILKFADYGFNKSHSVVYAMTTMALAYLKTYYPHEFYSELLSGTVNDPKKFQQIRSELMTLNIKILGPNIHTSTLIFKTYNNDLLFPLGAINGLNYDSAKEIISLRNNTPFNSIEDFFFRTYKAGIKEDELSALIESGALDSFHKNRAYLQKMLNSFLPSLEIGLFNDEKALKNIIVSEDVEDKKIRINNEVNRLRFPLSENPLSFYKIKDSITISELLTKESGFYKTFGLLTSAREIKTRKGERMAFATISNYEENLNLVIFPRTLKELKETLKVNEVYVVQGKLEHKDDELQLVVASIERYQND